ncbi:sigma-54-dependent Fis family transcriptional regulator [bacterium]|nr:sigma-54-dependent Fis family transcriptional regulator [bacterium]MCI0602215.1 sigma-54-dependent Fis family transcriptional regulator [bacterium]
MLPKVLESLATLNSLLQLDDLLPAVLDVTLDLTGADRAFVVLDEKDRKFSVQAGRNSAREDLTEQDFSGSTTVIEKARKELQSVYIPRLTKDAQFADAESVRKLQLKSAIAIPLFQRENAFLGVIYIDSTSMVSPLTEEHLQIMKALANYVSISIENAKLFEEVREKNREIESLNSQLQKRVEVQAGNLAEMRHLLAETQRELKKVFGLETIVGKSQPMKRIFRILEKVVGTSASVLITGESGTGKEQIARYLHHFGPRSEKPMVSINCSAFSDTLLESELFGHRKGAFTGADENKIGLFQVADGGTLFLDEVGDMSEEMQKKLLRILQEGELRPVGSKENIKVDVRMIAATNKDLEELIKQGKFRNDLYFRLNVIHILLPPLRERREDIPLLIDHFMQTVCAELQQPVKPLPPEIMMKFLEYDWPGNVRQLANEIRRVLILESEYLPLLPPAEEDDRKLSTVEKKAILKALESTLGNKSKAADLLGMSRSAFYEKLAKYQIQ